jgi:flavorubredoxin
LDTAGVDDATRCDEIADGIYRISTYVSRSCGDGFTVNQFLVLGEEPLLFHTGFRTMWWAVAHAIDRVMPVEDLRWLSFGHVEGDECGAMNILLAAAPDCSVAFQALGCDLSIRDIAVRPPRSLSDGDALDLGGRRVRVLATPHVPHNWEAQVLYEETTRTLLCGDLLTQAGPCAPLATGDVVTRALETEAVLRSAPRGHIVSDTARRLALLEPATLAVMHGASCSGDGGEILRTFARAWDERFSDTGTGPSHFPRHPA